MEQSKDYTCRSLATDLSTKLGRQVKVSFPKIIPPSGNYPYMYVATINSYIATINSYIRSFIAYCFAWTH